MDHEGRTSTSARRSTEEHDDAVVRSTVVVVVEGVVRVGCFGPVVPISSSPPSRDGDCEPTSSTFAEIDDGPNDDDR